MTSFRHESLSLHYETFGDGPAEHTVVFLHGLLLSSEMMAPVARSFGERFRVVNFEMRGHGRSSRPHDPDAYSLEGFAGDLVALADELGCARVGIFGTSLGADVALETMLRAPDRIAGAILEMPVLEAGAATARRVFRPFARALRSKRASRVLGAVARRMPAWPPGFPEAAAMLAEDPGTGAAVIEGLLREQMGERWDRLPLCPVPAMVIAHKFDPLHAYRDSVRLARMLPAGRLVDARSILELRLRPGRILFQAIQFMAEVFRSEGEMPTEGTGAGSGAAR